MNTLRDSAHVLLGAACVDYFRQHSLKTSDYLGERRAAPVEPERIDAVPAATFYDPLAAKRIADGRR